MIPLLIHQVFSYGIFALSLLTNSSFILISSTTLSDQIGSYRFLMIGFAVMDIMVSIIHLILMPGIQLTSVGYIFFGYHLVNMPAFVGTWAGILFVIFFYQTFIILAFHYIYRYAIVCDPIWRKIFVRNKTFWWSCISTLAQLLYTFGYYEAVQIGFMPSDYKFAHYRPIMRSNAGVDSNEFGYLAIIFRQNALKSYKAVIFGVFACSCLDTSFSEHQASMNEATKQGSLWKESNNAKPSPISSRPEVWQTDALIAILIAVGLFGATAIVIVGCSALILRKLSAARSVLLSTQMRTTQRQLLKALVIQTLIPSIFSYIPLAMIFLVPLAGLNFAGPWGDLMIMSTAVFPAIDPLIMLYFVRSYRSRIVFIWRAFVHPNLPQVYAPRQTSPTTSQAIQLRRTA